MPTPPEQDQLRRVYLQTTYTADTPTGDPLLIRIGRSHPDLDRHLQLHGCDRWAFVTAWNPGSQPLTDAENQQRQCQLMKSLEQQGYQYWTGRGIGDDGSWPPEESVLVFGMSCEQAIQTGLQYGQNATVWGALGQPAELIFCHRSEPEA